MIVQATSNQLLGTSSSGANTRRDGMRATYPSLSWINVYVTLLSTSYVSRKKQK